MAIDDKFELEHDHEPEHDHDHDVESLIEVGKEKGYLTYGDVNDIIPDEMATSPEDLDDLITTMALRASTCWTAPSSTATRASSWKMAKMLSWT